jgi:hypothetical protein
MHILKKGLGAEPCKAPGAKEKHRRSGMWWLALGWVSTRIQENYLPFAVEQLKDVSTKVDAIFQR